MTEPNCIAHRMLSNIRTADVINTLNAKLNSICHLLAFLETHNILYVSRIRVKTIKYFVMRNEVTFTSCGPPVLSSALAPAERQNKSK